MNLDEKWINSTASFVSSLDPSPPSLVASPWPPRSDPQFRSYPKVSGAQSVRHSYFNRRGTKNHELVLKLLWNFDGRLSVCLQFGEYARIF